MSMGQGTQAPAGSEVTEEDNPSGQPVEEEQEPEAGGELSNPFLANIPEEDRPIVEKYAKQWDAGVTRRFQEIHNQYRPYKDLGDVEELQRAIQIANFIRENPDQLYQVLHEQYGGQQQPQQGTVPSQPASLPGTQTQNLSLEGLPEELAPLAQMLQQQEQQYGTRFKTYDDKMGQIEQTLNLVAEYVVKQLETSAQSKEDQELDDYLKNLHTEFGDFDDDYVLTKIAAGIKPDDAVKAYKQSIQKYVNESRRPDPSVPAVLSGGGGTPSNTRNPEDLSQEETKALVANVLAQAHRQ